MSSPHSPNQNHLLASLPAAEFERLVPHLELVPMLLGDILYEPGGRLQHVYFPTTAIVSLLYVMESGAPGRHYGGRRASRPRGFGNGGRRPGNLPIHARAARHAALGPGGARRRARLPEGHRALHVSRSVPSFTRIILTRCFYYIFLRFPSRYFAILRALRVHAFDLTGLTPPAASP